MRFRLLLVLAAAALLAPQAAMASPATLDQRTRKFAADASDCVRRANAVWKTTPQRIKAALGAYRREAKRAVGRCLAAHYVLQAYDDLGQWRSFESAARLGIGAVLQWEDSLFDLVRTFRHPSKAEYAKAMKPNAEAVILWRSFIHKVNALRAAAGLPPFKTPPP
jgi:hypothetical protein